MLGWELPPLITGGLGPACNGIFRALQREGVAVLFVVPHAAHGEVADSENVIGALDTGEMAGTEFGSFLPYASSYGLGLYGKNIMEEVVRFAEMAAQIVRGRSFDIIHAHDWITCKAGRLVHDVMQKPLVVHIHSIEHDRSPANPNPEVCNLEKEGLLAADRVIAVSRYTRRRICENYRVDPRKVTVVHNGVDETIRPSTRLDTAEKRPKIVLFAGRLTAQKGPQYFLLAAEKVLKVASDVRFFIVGDGDERSHLEKMAAEMNITDSVLFTGFLSRFDLDRIYALASVCVMTSVSEPFGLVALEAIWRGVPVIVPRHAGVTEVVRHCLRVDYWDVDGIAAAILAVIGNHSSLADELTTKAAREVRKLTWKKAARRLIGIYRELPAAI